MEGMNRNEGEGGEEGKGREGEGKRGERRGGEKGNALYLLVIQRLFYPLGVQPTVSRNSFS